MSPRESAVKTTSRSVQPFDTAHPMGQWTDRSMVFTRGGVKVHPDLNTWFVRLGSQEHSVHNKLISSALYPNPKKHIFSQTRLRLLSIFDVSVLDRVRDVTTFVGYMTTSDLRKFFSFVMMTFIQHEGGNTVNTR